MQGKDSFVTDEVINNKVAKENVPAEDVIFMIKDIEVNEF